MKMLNLKSTLWTLLLVVFIGQIHAQGWRNTYNATGFNIGYTLHNTPDGGFLLDGDRHIKTDADGEEQWIMNTGNDINTSQGNRRSVLLADGSYVTLFYDNAMDTVWIGKYDSFGSVLWTKPHVPPTSENGLHTVTSIDVTHDGGFVFTVNYKNPICSCWRYVVTKTDGDGEFVWQADSGNNLDYQANSIKTLTDGGFAVAGLHGNIGGSSLDMYLEKRDSNGAPLWEKDYLITGLQYFQSVIESADGNIVVAGYGNDSTNMDDVPVYMAKLDQTGDEVWFNQWTLSKQAQTYDLKETPNGDYVVVGHIGDFNTPPPFMYQGFILLADEDGNEVWRRELSNDDYFETLFSVQPCPDGGFAISGYDNTNFQGAALLIKTDSLGNIYTHHLTGKVYVDDDLDCTYDSGETDLAGWIVTAVGDETFYGSTDSDGQYSILVDTGEYELMVALPSPLWDVCQPSYTVQASNVYDTTELDIPVQIVDECPFMSVDISTPFIRPCFESFYSVSYCNYGTETAVDATIEVELDSAMTFLSTTGNLQSQNGQILVFDLGDVLLNECGSFIIDYETACDSTLIGQSLCTEAHIFPDSLCGGNYDGPIIEIDAFCENDSVKFNIQNTGGDMDDVFEYIIIEDHIILLQDEFQLMENGEELVAEMAMPNSTYHIVAAQSLTMPPYFGNPVVVESLEGCVGVSTPGFFGEFQQNEGEPWLAIECREATASFDPNDKTAYPTGFTEEHLIENRTDLEYRIRFQNTGTDTAFNVVLVDTLSAFLDPATLRPGASSHPYTFELSGEGVAKFKFANIYLPDSTTNEAASNGFVNFKIIQQPDNEVGTVIENFADIYFDFNAPIRTNTVFHTIGDWWVDIVSSSVEVFQAGLEVSVFPNPFFENATFKLEGFNQSGTLQLFSQNGQMVVEKAFAEGKTQVQRNQLSNGIYFFKMMNEGGVLATGKVVVQ